MVRSPSTGVPACTVYRQLPSKSPLMHYIARKMHFHPLLCRLQASRLGHSFGKQPFETIHLSSLIRANDQKGRNKHGLENIFIFVRNTRSKDLDKFIFGGRQTLLLIAK